MVLASVTFGNYQQPNQLPSASSSIFNHQQPRWNPSCASLWSPSPPPLWLRPPTWLRPPAPLAPRWPPRTESWREWPDRDSVTWPVSASLPTAPAPAAMAAPASQLLPAPRTTCSAASPTLPLCHAALQLPATDPPAPTPPRWPPTSPPTTACPSTSSSCTAPTCPRPMATSTKHLLRLRLRSSPKDHEPTAEKHKLWWIWQKIYPKICTAIKSLKKKLNHELFLLRV